MKLSVIRKISSCYGRHGIVGTDSSNEEVCLKVNIIAMTLTCIKCTSRVLQYITFTGIFTTAHASSLLFNPVFSLLLLLISVNEGLLIPTLPSRALSPFLKILIFDNEILCSLIVNF